MHVTGTTKGRFADGNTGVVYLEGEGDFVLTDTATGAENRVPIEAGKLISWPNAGFTHRVESSSSIRRRALGPVTFDAFSNSLVGVTFPEPVECQELAGYQCVDPPANYFVVGTAPDGGNCTLTWCVVTS